MTTVILNRREFLAVGVTLLATSELAQAHNGTVHIAIENLAFLPDSVEAKVGNIIEWTNKDDFEHTATVDGRWEVLILPGQKATHVVTKDDNVEYYCRFHPNMKGRISVIKG